MASTKGAEDQRYRRWWERRFDQNEPTSLFDLMYEDLDLVQEDSARYVVDDRPWTPQYEIDERFSKKHKPA